MICLKYYKRKFTILQSWELIHNKGYQSSEVVSSVVTTKVKGQGFVPVNKQRDKSLNKSDPLYYEKLYQLNSNVSYRILDTAGKLDF
jgi:hypothetical protein